MKAVERAGRATKEDEEEVEAEAKTGVDERDNPEIRLDMVALRTPAAPPAAPEAAACFTGRRSCQLYGAPDALLAGSSRAVNLRKTPEMENKSGQSENKTAAQRLLASWRPLPPRCCRPRVHALTLSTPLSYDTFQGFDSVCLPAHIHPAHLLMCAYYTY